DRQRVHGVWPVFESSTGGRRGSRALGPRPARARHPDARSEKLPPTCRQVSPSDRLNVCATWFGTTPEGSTLPSALGRGQAVRRGTLDPVFEGSNPSAPATTRGQGRAEGPPELETTHGG